ncbi:outer membrane protein [Altererythrobacter atlanticus]|uniref:Outer membrane efflux protein BepC n=1 Tax=Croceibacterium atlanticum TaxID=1267766 RepID=A0A0F7KT95_9SPHN|nr:TolC family protein [Croceibacterium atlanticum]AKH42824.1 Outer membrane efflux protein BepC precursor [Croceibacterium atlanticum]MBB5731604.1 outer membrane protein [Croceibacterium atlanticum]
MRRKLILLTATATFALPLNAAAQSLDETIAASMANSPTLAAARAREDAADAAVKQARAERMPQASVEGQIGTGRLNPKGYFGLSADDVTPRSAQATVELPIFTGGKIGSAVRQAKGGAEIAELATYSTMLDLRLQVVRSFTNALSAKEEVKSYSALQASLAEVLRQAKLSFNAGGATATDVAQAEARLAEAEAGLARAQGNLAAGMGRLEALAGERIDPSGDLPPPPETPADLDASVELAVLDNPQVEQARRAADIAHAGVSAARAEYLPDVGLYAEAASVRDQFFPGYTADSASVGVRGRWTFFSGGRTGAKVTGAEANERAALADIRAAELEVRTAAIQSFEALRAATLMRIAADKRVAATQEALRGTRLEVEVGAKPQLALLDAEREAIAARVAQIDAAGQVLVAAYTLRAVTGMDGAP